jgi:hypothetical protein
MKTLKIEIPKGYEIDVEKSNIANGTIVFKEIKKELPKTWEELEKLQGYYVSGNSFIREANTSNNEYARPPFATKEQAEASIALAQLSQLREVYRQSWKPDWGDGTIKKFCIIPLEKELKIDTWWKSCNFFLSFQSEEIAEQFLENFRDLIEKAKPLMS